MTQANKLTIVKEIMQRDVLTIYPDQTIFDACVLMASQHIGSIPVIKEDGTLVGIITDRDIVTRCNAISKDMRKTKIFECMTSNPIRTVPSVTIADAMTLMGEYGIRRLPIVKNDKLTGMVSISDIATVSGFCPNEKYPDETCILLDMAREIQKSSHCHQGCNTCQETMV